MSHRVVVGISGGIAAYKSAALVSRLVQRGFDVSVVLTEAAEKFIGAATFSALSCRPPILNAFDSRYPLGPHIELATDCRLFIVAPATAHIMASCAFGLADCLLSRFQINESEILAGQVTNNLRLALKVWVELARTSLVSGLPLVKLTPRWLARDIQLFVRGGLALLDNIAIANFNVWDQQITVSKKQKMTLFLRAILSTRSIQVSELARPRGSKTV